MMGSCTNHVLVYHSVARLNYGGFMCAFNADILDFVTRQHFWSCNLQILPRVDKNNLNVSTWSYGSWKNKTVLKVVHDKIFSFQKNMTDEEAAVRIQSSYKGFKVRKGIQGIIVWSWKSSYNFTLKKDTVTVSSCQEVWLEQISVWRWHK